ncbi:hypothetical protein PBY51_022533 [Eleginops maclovinus]|uniref:Ig-like domain-containing protein n=2 Tax=Eleginops maclovinus TaxID=56733 RepID=A0AAN7XI41_ELEMC|nr:hypothetical protein PBY51_022533 [Eleginops maclovinus]
MQILTTGVMEEFSKNVGINWTFFKICCMFWIFSPAEGNNISRVVGSTAILHCGINSNSTLNQLTWKMNSVILFSFTPQGSLHNSDEARRLDINMSLSESHLYALVIEKVQKTHEGNYTCEISTVEGVEEQKWELKITEEAVTGNVDKLNIAAAVVVPCMCCLVFLLALIVQHRCHKQRAVNRSRTSEMRPEELIYENCLETDVRQKRKPQVYNLPKTATRQGGVQY